MCRTYNRMRDEIPYRFGFNEGIWQIYTTTNTHTHTHSNRVKKRVSQRHFVKLENL